LLLGLFVGFAALIRWSLILYASLPVIELLLLISRTWGIRGRLSLGRAGVCSLGAIAGAALAFTPQMVAWRLVFGEFLIVPTPQVRQHWMMPSLWEVLASTDRSLFYWTPITLVAFLGFLAYVWPVGPSRVSPLATSNSVAREPMAILFVSFVLQVYSRASVLGEGSEFLPDAGFKGGVFLGEAFGCRFLSESVAALTPGFAAFLDHLGPRMSRAICAIGWLLVIWNILLIYQYCFGFLSRWEGAGPSVLFNSTVLLGRVDPFTIVYVVMQVALIGLVVGCPNGRKDSTT
jgi:hypothetical protein